MGQELDQKIQDVFSRIQKERKILEASKLMRQATANQEVLKQNEAKIRETERSLSYFENTLQELQARKMQEDNPTRSSTSSSTSGLPSSPRSTFSSVDRDRSLPQIPSSQAGPSGAVKGKQMTALDLIKADTPLTTAKISKMLHQLEFKLQVEMQYKKGIDKMAKLYQADGDKRSKVEAEAKRIESEKKIQLLQASLKHYKNLHVLDDAAEAEETDGLDTNGERKENIRAKPLSGTLRVTVKGARELDHMPIPTLARVRSASKQGVDTFVSLKVEGAERPAVSHPSRTDRWNEDFEIAVDKANEVEIVLYDKQAGQVHQVPIGMLWIRISDLVEALRRQKVFMESGQGGWVTAAGAMSGDGSSFGSGPPHHPGADAPLNLSYPGSSGNPMGLSQAQADGVDAWFSVEPAGAVALRLDFIKENVRKRPADGQLGGLGRQGAVRKRKGEVHEMNGHKFVQKQFYQLMLCAFCNDFLLNALGYQCEDCRYTCHKKCYEKVVTKCISKSNTGEEDDAEKINHRIPHRFEALTNIGANWCCHCGYMLPLGRKNARKCSECDVTCHANCAHLVPDFCGMSMETANEILRNLRVIKKTRGGKPPTTGRPSPYSQGSSSFQSQASDSSATITQGMVGMKVAGPDYSTGEHPGRPHSTSISSMDGRLPDGRPPHYQQYQQPHQTPPSHPTQLPPGARPPPGQPNVRMPVASPAYPGSSPQDVSQTPYDQHMQPRPHIPQQPTPPKQPQPGFPSPHHGPQKQPQSQAPLPGHVQPPPRQPQWQGPPAEQPQVPAPPQQRPKRKVGLDDFNFLAVLGKGNFGKVMLAEEKKTNGLYAIKVLKKEFIIDNDEVDSTRSEKRVFQAAARERHPFLLGLHSCFQTETRIYFVMEYISGGDLMLHIQRKQFSLRQAKFYACEVLLALEYFHANGIIYRDLKLDNILLTLDGHVKVGDYGLCKEEMWYGSTTSTFCGTPEFMAPEILLEQRYGRAVDWWAFGVLTYEMLLGQSPFRGDDEDEIFDAILEDEPLYPITMPRDAVSILQQLLTRDPQRRLGSGKEDAAEIKRQPFFKDVSWDDVFHKRIPPPYLPTIKGSADTSNFDEEFTREQPTLTPVHGQLSSRDQAEFAGFSWIANWADI